MFIDVQFSRHTLKLLIQRSLTSGHTMYTHQFTKSSIL